MGFTVLEALTYCVFPLPGKENKKSLYFLSSKSLSPYFFGIGAQGAKILATILSLHFYLSFHLSQPSLPKEELRLNTSDI